MQHIEIDKVVLKHSKLGNERFRGALEGTIESAGKDV